MIINNIFKASSRFQLRMTKKTVDITDWLVQYVIDFIGR